jgi:hypothetical protein
MELCSKVDLLRSHNKDQKESLTSKIEEPFHFEKSITGLQERNLELEMQCMYPSIPFQY